MKEETNSNETSSQTPAVARILIVDDDSTVLDVFPHLFRPGQYSIAVASRGSLAIELATHRTYDLAFVDYYMDDMDGVTVSNRLRHLQPDIKIVLMSGYSFDNVSELLIRSGAREFLHKPLKADGVQKLTDRLLSRDWPPAAPPSAS
jgi:CheY-like chemotaxis protein